MARGSICDVRALQREQQVALGHHLVADEAVPVRRARAAGARLPSVTSSAQPIPGHDLAAELGVVDAAQKRARVRRRLLPLEQQQRGHLGQRLHHQHAGHQGSAGEMALEELLADRDVLHGDHAPAGLVLDDGIHQEGGVAIGQAVEEQGDIDGQRVTRSATRM